MYNVLHALHVGNEWGRHHLWHRGNSECYWSLVFWYYHTRNACYNRSVSLCLYLKPYNCVTVDPCSTVSLKRQIIKVVATTEDISSPDRSLQQEERRKVEERRFFFDGSKRGKGPGVS